MAPKPTHRSLTLPRNVTLSGTVTVERALTTSTTETYVSLSTPRRVLETRSGLSTADGQFAGIGRRGSATTLRLDIAGRVGIPTDAAAVAVNVTATGAPVAGFVTVVPCGVSRPSTSTLNFVAGQSVANSAIVKIGTGGEVCLYTNQATDLIVDVSGYFPPDTYIGLARPLRFVETRPGFPTDDGRYAGGGIRPPGSVLAFDVAGRSGVPADATSVVLNVTVTGARANGFATIYPCGVTRPTASNLNYIPAQSKANMVVAKVGADGQVCLFTNQAANFIVDVSGILPDNVYTPLGAPRRILETRAGLTTVDGQFNGIGLRSSGTSTRVRVAGRAGVPANASAVILNLTATQAVSNGFATVFPKGVSRPNASNVNYPASQSIPNAVVAKIGANGDICVYAHRATHLVLDVAGYLTGPAPSGSGDCPQPPPPPQPPTPPQPPSNPGDSKNCSDFDTYAQAKAWFDTYFPYYGDVARLDSDGDGIPCESLPGAP